MLSQPAEEKSLPTGFTSTKLDKGHKGMTLDDFVKSKEAVAAELDRATCWPWVIHDVRLQDDQQPLREEGSIRILSSPPCQWHHG